MSFLYFGANTHFHETLRFPDCLQILINPKQDQTFRCKYSERMSVLFIKGCVTTWCNANKTIQNNIRKWIVHTHTHARALARTCLRASKTKADEYQCSIESNSYVHTWMHAYICICIWNECELVFGTLSKYWQFFLFLFLSLYLPLCVL